MNERVQFGLFEFDLSSGQLWRDGRQVRLQPQPARVLAMLIEAGGQVVSRDHLRQQIWPTGTFVDFDRGLNFSIAQVRAALGDAADSPRFIETLPRRGYRFMAPVRTLGPSAAASEEQPLTAVESPQPPVNASRRGASRLAIGAVLALAALGAILMAAFTHPAPVRVAVVPFDNETGQDAFDQVARGVADATVARLASPDRVSRLDVIGNSAALTAPRAFRDVKVIGERVAADYVVLAQMKSDGTGVRLIAHLIRVSDEAHVWADSFDRPAFTLEVQAEIAEAIAQAVFSRLARS